MTQQELTELNIGENLDSLVNLDPRGYGVCRILYDAARKYTGGPLTMNAACQLVRTIKKGDLVYILTGFVLIPYKKAEMDGIVSAMMLARALVKAFEARPVVICPEDNLVAVQNLAPVVGLHLRDSIEALDEYPLSMAVIPFTKDVKEASTQAETLIAKGRPSAVISIEAPGANRIGVYHNSVGKDVTEHEAKSDVLFERLQSLGILSIAIGDLGNEIGMGSIGEHLNTYIPYAAPNACSCGCGGGIAVRTKADHIITATVSDWGCDGMIAALAFLKEDPDILQSGELEREAVVTASRSGMIDMYGWLIPSIDGCGLEMNVLIVNLMRECITRALSLKETCAVWFQKVLELGFYTR